MMVTRPPTLDFQHRWIDSFDASRILAKPVVGWRTQTGPSVTTGTDGTAFWTGDSDTEVACNGV